LINIGLISLLYVALSSKIDSLGKVIDAKFEAAHQNLLRVGQVLDARLKHLEKQP